MGRYELSPAKPWDIDFIAEMGAGFWKLAHPGLQWRTQSELESLLRSLEQELEACFHLVLDVHNNKKVGATAFLAHPGDRGAYFLLPQFHSELYVTGADLDFTLNQAIDWARKQSDYQSLSTILLEHQEELRDMLVERGFVVEARESVMVCALDKFIPEKNSDFVIQALSPDSYDDCRSALRLLSGHFPGHYSAERLERDIARGWVICLAKERKDDPEALGLIAWTEPSLQPYTDLLLTRVSPHAKGRAVASTLLAHFLGHSKTMGRSHARANIDPDEGPSHWLLERAGFRDTQNIMRLRKSFKVESY